MFLTTVATNSALQNGVLYTFSTIAQALGGIVALLSAFILYRFQSLDATMWDDSEKLKSIWTHDAELLPYDWQRASGNYAHVIREIEVRLGKMKGDSGVRYPYSATQRSLLGRLERSVEFHRFISNRFKRTLVVSGGVLIGSVVAIPFADMLSGCVVWAWIVMIAGVLAFAVCIILYGFLIRAVLGMATFESKQVASLISW